MKKIITILLIIAIPILFAEDSKLPTLKLKNLEKKKVNLKEYYSKGLTLMNFWTLSCEPCRKEMKHLDSLNIKYADNSFQVISINMDTPRSMSKVKAYVESQKYTFTVLSDPKSESFRKTGGNVMPYILIVDTVGTILNRHVGYNPGDEIELEKEIIEILGLNKEEKEEIIPELNEEEKEKITPVEK